MKVLLLAAAALGLAVSVQAQNTGANPPAKPIEETLVETGRGLLGQRYAGLTYSYTDIRTASINSQGLRFDYNVPLNTGFDARFTYDGARSGPIAGGRNSTQLLEGSALAFMQEFGWTKPYLEVGGGWIWTRTAGDRDSSFAARLGAGAEFQLTPVLVVTPYAAYTHAAVLVRDHMWNYGLKGNCWLTNQWGLNAGIDRDNHLNMAYSAGVNLRF